MIIKSANRLDPIQEYYFSMKLRQIAEMRALGMNVLNLGIGSPDLPPAPEVVQQLCSESAKPNSHAYQSYKGIPELRQAMAAWYQNCFAVSLDAEREILPLMGSKEGIFHLAMSFLQTGDEALVPNPSYPTYRAASALAGATVVEYALSEKNAWLPDIEALEKTDLSRVKIMWLNYPHMPTGAHATRACFEKLVAFAHKHQILLVNDNPYSFILNDKHLSLLAISGAKPVALELNSLSKSHNMAGWRIGMLLGEAAYLDTVLKFKSNMDSGMFKPLQVAAVEALKLDCTWNTALNQQYKKRQLAAFRLLDKLECQYNPSLGGMFIWAKIPPYCENAYQYSDQILQKSHVFITPGGIFGSQGERYLRISLCSPVEQLNLALERIETTLALA